MRLRRTHTYVRRIHRVAMRFPDLVIATFGEVGESGVSCEGGHVVAPLPFYHRTRLKRCVYSTSAPCTFFYPLASL